MRLGMLGIALAALALIFLPMIFDTPDAPQPRLQSRIPPPPTVPQLPEPVQSRPVILANTPAINVPADARAVEEAAGVDGAAGWRELPILDERGLPRGWSLRVGVFAREAEARLLLERLLEAGYRAYIRPLQPDPGTPRTVLVGPWLGRDTAREYQDRLARELDINGVILPFAL